MSFLCHLIVTYVPKFGEVKLEDGQVFYVPVRIEYSNNKIFNVNNYLGVDKTVLGNHGDGNRPYSSRFRT